MELSPVQRRIRDFYFKEALAAPRSASHVHKRALVPDQALFSIDDLRRHLNNPLLDLNYINLFLAGKPVDLSSARFYKVVQRRRIEFVDRRVLDEHFRQGAACVLEGVDILEPQVNALAAALDRAHAATFSNATVFFSQRGHEAYRGHVDTDDVLVIHLAGEKRWKLYRPQPPRRVALTDLSDAEMGMLETEIVMRPGDALFLRSFTPHKVETLSPCSLHLSFDLCDRQPSIEVALQMLLQRYDGEAATPLTPPAEALDKLFSHARSDRYRADLGQALANDKAGHGEFRKLVASNRVSHLDHFVTGESVRRPDETAPAGALTARDS
jgi:ribosomal protein L16 Arg81 hydroxylase